MIKSKPATQEYLINWEKIFGQPQPAEKALYRKINDRTQNSSTYHKKDGTSVRTKLKKK